MLQNFNFCTLLYITRQEANRAVSCPAKPEAESHRRSFQLLQASSQSAHDARPQFWTLCCRLPLPRMSVKCKQWTR